MKRITMGLILLSSLLLGSPSTTAATENTVQDWLQQQLASGQIGAAVVAEIHGDKIEVRGLGSRGPEVATPPDAQTQFQIGSVTKVFTNLLLAEMIQDGTVSNSTTLGELLPDFEPRNPAIASISLLSLATHRSGLPRLPANLIPSDQNDPYAGYDDASLLAGLTAAREHQPLGSFYTYSNFGLGTLGHVLGRAHGDGYFAALSSRVVTPLRLQHTGFEPGANAARAVVGGKAVSHWNFEEALSGIGALWGSVDDLARVLQAYLGTHSHGLSHTLDSDLQVLPTAAGGVEVTPVWHVARGEGQPIYWHNGSTAGFSSFVGFRPDQQRGIAILLSGDADPTGTGLAALGEVTTPAAAPDIDAGVLGQYQLNEQFGIGVLESRGRLVAQATGQPQFAIHALGGDWYAFGGVDASLQFLRRGDGVIGLRLVQGGQVQEANRVADVAAVSARTAALDEAASQASPDAAQLEDYVGAFAFAPGIELSIRRAGEVIEAQLTGQPWFPVLPGASDRFYYKVVEAELQFERNADGKVTAVVLHQGGVEQRAARLP